MFSQIHPGVCECKDTTHVSGIMGTFVRMGSLINTLHENRMSWAVREMELLKERVELSLAIWSVPQPGKAVRGGQSRNAGKRELS